MANSFKNKGDRIDYINSGSAILAGAVVTLLAGAAGRIGVAIDAIPATTGEGAVAVEGVFELAAETGVAWAMGDKLYWSGTLLTKTVGTNPHAGYAFVAKGSAVALGRVKLAG
jgi:predicted RecA/RadA family phage recombinase